MTVTEPDSIPDLTLGKLLREKELWLLVLLILVFYRRPLFFGETFFFRDLSYHFLPQRQLLAQMLRNLELPYWDPYSNTGMPFLANPNNLVLYPSSLLYLVLPSLTAFTWEIVGHVFLGSLACYVLLRVLTLNPASSLIGSVIFTFTGYNLSQVDFLNRTVAMAYVPLIFLFWHLFLCRKKRRWFVAAVICGALQVFSGAPETVLCTFLLILGWSIWGVRSDGSLKKKMSAWFLLSVFTVGLCLIQLLPVAELYPGSLRKAMQNASGISWSLHPKRLPELVIPKFLGAVDKLAADDFWGQNLEHAGFPLNFSIYFGILTGFLAIYFGLTKPRDATAAIPGRFLLLFAAVALLLSLGAHLPLFLPVYRAIPFISSFRYPQKFLTAAILPVCILAAAGSTLHFSPQDSRLASRKSLVFFSCMLLVFTFLTADMRISPATTHQAELFFFGRADAKVDAGLFASMLHVVAILVLATGLYLWRSLQENRLQLWVLLAVLALDLILAGSGIVISAPRELLSTVPGAVRFLRGRMHDERIYHAPGRDPVLRAPSNDAMWQTRWNLVVLKEFAPKLYQVPTAYHGDLEGLGSREMGTLTQIADQSDWKIRLPFLSAASVRYVITRGPVPGLEPLIHIENSSNVDFILCENPGFAPAVTLLNKWIVAESEPDVLTSFLSPAFDPRTTVILQGKNLPSPAPSCTPPDLQEIGRKGTWLSLKTSSPCDSYLTFSDPYYPGWKATIDGKEAPVIRANYAFTAIPVPPGSHVVTRWYAPASAARGLAGSILSCLVFLLFLHSGFIRRTLFSSSQ